ncbi:26S proteasome non-ATPase regulatory subunit 6-like [Schistocerca piceifrons]|uniref:26S proteasome non-ATPase regulatory subunit 6-like n=1 Tax=Schistocerca piceifrons TaxID=274613 RepID=UPI001F5E74B5|nr:26S proteasome non-ATPase regulatory subunit 6-like [Schistocerca piceifrons]
MPIDYLEDEGLAKNPNLKLAQWKFRLSLHDRRFNKELQKQLLEAIKSGEMAPIYVEWCKSLKWTVDEELLSRLKQRNMEKLKQLNDEIEDAEKNLGEMEVQGAYMKKSEYLCTIGAKDEAVKNFQITYDKTVSLGQRLEIVFYLIRIGFFYWDHDLITRNIDKAESLIEEGDSWEHRNRMKVYKGIYSMMKRDFKSAANSFLDSSLTFTCYELMDYHEFIRYIVLMGVISVPRNELKEKIIKNSEVLEVLHNDRFMKDYVMSLYDCHYAEFFKNLAQVEDFLKHDYYLSPHYRHYIREMRLRAYTQILQCYQSLTLDFMADTFGVTAEFIDKELSRFISDRRVDGKIDKVSNIVVTDHPDAKNWQYQEIIRQGDTLLNRVQKLSRVINI